MDSVKTAKLDLEQAVRAYMERMSEFYAADADEPRLAAQIVTVAVVLGAIAYDNEREQRLACKGALEMLEEGLEPPESA